jgi:hypothetical protein
MIISILGSMFFQGKGGKVMSRLKAVVLEKNGSLLTVLSSDGSFQKVRHKGKAEIGSEIEISTPMISPVWRIGASVAAIFLMVFMGIFGWNAFQPRTAVAMLSVDINPSLQLTLDREGRVLEQQFLNPDAEQVLSGLSLKGEPWKEALGEILEKSVDLNYLNPQHNWIIVGYSPIEPDYILPPDEMNPEIISEQVEEVVSEKGITPKVAVYELSAEEHSRAQETGLTLGEYALVNTAQKAGVHVEPQEVKKTDERVRLLEKPEIQEQMIKEKRIKGNSKALPATANPQAEKERNLEPAKQQKDRDDEKNNSKDNGKMSLDNPTGINPSGQSGKPQGESSNGEGQDKGQVKNGKDDIHKNEKDKQNKYDNANSFKTDWREIWRKFIF